MSAISGNLFLACIAATAAAAANPRVSLTQSPLVMRLSKDEFRIAFGISGECQRRNKSDPPSVLIAGVKVTHPS